MNSTRENVACLLYMNVFLFFQLAALGYDFLFFQLSRRDCSTEIVGFLVQLEFICDCDKSKNGLIDSKFLLHMVEVKITGIVIKTNTRSDYFWFQIFYYLLASCRRQKSKYYGNSTSSQQRNTMETAETYHILRRIMVDTAHLIWYGIHQFALDKFWRIIKNMKFNTLVRQYKCDLI